MKFHMEATNHFIDARISTNKHIFHKRITLAASCVLLSACIWAQVGTVQKSDAKPSQTLALASGDQSLGNHSSGRPHDDSFVIGSNDVLAVNVWKEPDISRSVPVRSDGKISLPLAGEVQAAGLTPLKLEREITTKLQAYISDPEVTVIVQQINSQKFNILGQILRPGSYPLTGSSTVLEAIALAGGFRDFAKQKAVYVLRQNSDGTQSRLPFNYKEVVRGKNSTQNVKLQPNDTIVVP
jgi:polysaccharide export outer membrane protein